MVRRASDWPDKSTGDALDSSKLHRIMVKFRPIAPKPDFTASASPNSSCSFYMRKSSRPKRRYVKVKRNTNSTTHTHTRAVSEEKKCATLSLLPETPDHKQTQTSTPVPQQPEPSQLVLPRSVTVGGSGLDLMDWVGLCVVIVESVTDTCVDVDVEKRMNLHKDTCPGFISDGCNTVRWMNEAYKVMVGHGGDGWPEMVKLVMKEPLPLIYPAFVCRVRLQYTWKKKKKSMVVPCDVWRMNGGDLAWRFDVQSALSLGR